MTNIITEDFFNLIKSKYKIYYNEISLIEDYDLSEFNNIPANLDKDLIIGVSVITGGFTGGNCWGDSVPYEFSTYNDLPYIKVFFNDLFLIFDNLNQDDILNLSDYSTYLSFEQYGNYNHYEYFYIKLIDLYFLYVKFQENKNYIS